MGEEAKLTLDNLAGTVDEPRRLSGSEILATDYNIKNVGNPDTFCATILELVADKRYGIAIDSLKYYQESKEEYPLFRERTDRYFDHCVEIIYAIRSKNNFPNLEALPRSKQTAVTERLKEHFQDLQSFLQQVGQVELELKLSDARSTTCVVNALFFSVLFLTILALIKEGFSTLGLSDAAFFQSLMGSVFEFLGL